MKRGDGGRATPPIRRNTNWFNTMKWERFTLYCCLAAILAGWFAQRALEWVEYEKTDRHLWREHPWYFLGTSALMLTGVLVGSVVMCRGKRN
jgi:hypothetical protein